MAFTGKGCEASYTPADGWEVVTSHREPFGNDAIAYRWSDQWYVGRFRMKSTAARWTRLGTQYKVSYPASPPDFPKASDAYHGLTEDSYGVTQTWVHLEKKR